MKSLTESLHASLINEGQEQIIVFFNHEYPEQTMIYTGADPNAVRLIQDSGWDWELVQGHGNALWINHSDEWCSVVLYQSVAKFKADNLKSIKDCIKKAGPNPDYIYIETLVDGFEIEDDVSDVAKMSDSQLYKRFVEDYISESFIDGDSASAKALVDLRSKNVVYCGEMDIQFYTDDDILSMFE